MSSNASAQTFVDGNKIRVYYNEHGLWNDPSAGKGWQLNDFGWWDMSYPITPWVNFVTEFSYNGFSEKYVSMTSTSQHDFTDGSNDVFYFGSERMYWHQWDAGPLEIDRYEVWDNNGKVQLVHMVVRNTGSSPVNSLRFMQGLDPDVDVSIYGPSYVTSTYGYHSYEHINDSFDIDGDGDVEYGDAISVFSGITIGFGGCEPFWQSGADVDVGWASFISDADSPIFDAGGTISDETLHWRHVEGGQVQPGETIHAAFITVWGTDPDDAMINGYLDNREYWCGYHDLDGDDYSWYFMANRDGTDADCDDNDPTIYPGAPEIPNDGIDQDCDGFDATTADCYEDYDLDGYGKNKTITSLDNDCNDPGESYVNTDCDDYNAGINPGEVDIPGDGIDQDCVGGDAPPINNDPDGDGLTNSQESALGTDPYNRDTDGDGIWDGSEVGPDGLYQPNQGDTDPLDPDTDNDNLSDGEEQYAGTNPLDPDSDNDDLLDGDEVFVYHTDPLDEDTDDDDLNDGDEIDEGTNPLRKDSDLDGLWDGEEVYQTHTNPTNPDTDGDDLVDGREVEGTGTDPLDPDMDGDGLTDGEEILETHTNPNIADTDADGLDDYEEARVYGTDPRDPDTDDGGMADGQEIDESLDPFDPSDDIQDTDKDGLLDNIEEELGTDPLNPDTDGDGLRDGEEVNQTLTDPLNPDSDQDGLNDGEEVYDYNTDPNEKDTDEDGLGDGTEVENTLTDPLNPDSDGDGLLDGPELATHHTDPLNPDTDGDDMDDGTEVENGANPNNPDTDGDGLLDGEDGLGDEDGDGILNVLDPLTPDVQMLPTGGVTACNSTSSTPLAPWLLMMFGLVLRRRGRK